MVVTKDHFDNSKTVASLFVYIQFQRFIQIFELKIHLRKDDEKCVLIHSINLLEKVDFCQIVREVSLWDFQTRLFKQDGIKWRINKNHKEIPTKDDSILDEDSPEDIIQSLTYLGVRQLSQGEGLSDGVLVMDCQRQSGILIGNNIIK